MDKHLDAEALSDYAEGLADAPARAAAESHLAACDRCRGELAAIRAYFRGMADLEPARAPANFLAQVRARLPRRSPSARAWAALLIPFRAVPVPIAVALILGVTAITVYLRQGGLESRAILPAPDVLPAPGDSPGEAPAAAAEAAPGKQAERSPAAEPVPASSPAAEADAAHSSTAPTSAEPARKELRPADAGSGAAASGAAPARQDKSRPRSPEALRDESEAIPGPGAVAPVPAPKPEPASPPAPARPASERPATAPARPASDRPATAPARPASDGPALAPPAPAVPGDAKTSPAQPAPALKPRASGDAAKRLRDVEVTGWLDNPSSVYILDNSRAPTDLPLDKSMPVEGESAVPGQAEAAAGHAAEARKAKEAVAAGGKKREGMGVPRAPDPAPAGKSGAVGATPASGYSLSLRAKGDTAAVLAGLRSMGAEIGPESSFPGESRFRLTVPAPMLRDIGPYLARHGESRAEGALPSSASGSLVTLRLRLVYPAR